MTEDKKNVNKKGGGMYSGVNVPVRLLDLVIGIGLLAIAVVFVIGLR